MDETKIFTLSLFNFVFLQYEKDLGFQGNRESLNNHVIEAKNRWIINIQMIQPICVDCLE